MAYAVYWRRPDERTFKRASEMVTATKGKFKGTLTPKDLRFGTLESAEAKANRYAQLGCETKIKEIK